jgi:hypothetical protein
MVNHTKNIKPGIQLGKENGLSILLDAEVILFQHRINLSSTFFTTLKSLKPKFFSFFLEESKFVSVSHLVVDSFATVSIFSN